VAVSGADSGAGRSSLDLGKNNSTSRETDENGRYDCRDAFDDMFYSGPGDQQAPYRCGSWDCYCCGYKMRQNLIEELEQLIEDRPEMCRLLTLTLDPEKVPDDSGEQHRYITERWNALRTRLKREVGDFSYVWVREEQDNGLPHIHAIVSRFLPQGKVSAAWADLGGGEVVDIRKIDRADNAAHYIGKYLTKDALSGLPDGIRRYGSSSDIDLDVRGGGDSDGDWRLLTDDDVTGVPRPVVKADFVLERGLDPPDG